MEARTLDDRDQHQTLEDDKISLRTAALEQIRKDSERECHTKIRVVVPPFTHASVKSDNQNSTTSIAGDQNEYPRKEALVDIIVTRSRHTEATCVAIVNLAPQRTDWTFARPYPQSRFFAATTIDSPAEPGAPSPIRKAGDNDHSLPVRMREYCLHLDAKMYDQGVPSQGDGKEHSTSNLLADTSVRTLEGTCGLIESFPPSITLHLKRRPFFVPIIVADAGIFSGEHDHNGATVSNLASQDCAIYDCPVPSGLRFPGYEDVNRPAPETPRWPILITKPEGLDDLLDRVYQMPVTKKED